MQNLKKNRANLIYSTASILLIVMAGALLYSSTLSVPFLFDDKLLVFPEDSKTNGIIDFISSQEIFFTRPLLGLSFAVNYKISRDSPPSYHITNICLHLINCVLIFFIIKNLICTVWNQPIITDYLLSLSGALIFLFHPLATESVVYVSGRSSLLYTVFLLLSVYLFLNSVKKDGLKVIFFLCLSLISYCAALASKEISVIFPLILFILVSFSSFIPSKKRLVLFFLPFLLLSFLYVTMAMPYMIGFESPDKTQRTLIMHVMTETYVFAESVLKTVFPVSLNFDPDYSDITSPRNFRFITGAFLFCIFLLAVFYFRRKSYFITASILWFLVSFSPHLFIRLRDYMSERWLYFPLIAVAFLPAGIFCKMVDRDKKKYFSKTLFIAAFLIVISVYAVMTISRLSVWQSEVSIWADAVKKSPLKFRTHANLGQALLKEGRYDEAEKENKSAMAINSQYAEIHYNMAEVYSNTGRDWLAIEEYNKALQYIPYYVNAGNRVYYHAMVNMGAVYLKNKQVQKAIDAFMGAVRIDTEKPQAYNNIGIVYMSVGRLGDAERFFLMAIEKKGDKRKAYLNLADLYIKQDRKERAWEVLRNAGLMK